MPRYIVDESGKLAEAAPAPLPLIYTTVYGSDIYYECLLVFIKSLILYGKYKGKILIFTDRIGSDVERYIPEEALSQVSLVAINHKNYSQRYVSGDFSMNDFCPIVYFDNDIVFDLDIYPMLHKIWRASGACVVTEDETYPEMSSQKVADIVDSRRIGNWWGLEIIRSDFSCHDKIFPLVNSGVIGFPDYYMFSTIGGLVFDLYNSPPNESLAKWFGDQPFLNYVLVKTGLGEYTTLRGTCRFLGSAEAFSSDRRGLVHFNWARNEDKPTRMKAYLEYLRLLS